MMHKKKRMHATMIIPSTQLVEKKATFRVSRGLSWVQSGDRLWGSDSPVSEELSTWWETHTHKIKLRTKRSQIVLKSQIRNFVCVEQNYHMNRRHLYVMGHF